MCVHVSPSKPVSPRFSAQSCEQQWLLRSPDSDFFGRQRQSQRPAKIPLLSKPGPYLWIRYVEQGFWLGKYMGVLMHLLHRNTSLRRNENILHTKGTTELYYFIHGRGFIDVTISQRATTVKALGLAGPAPGSSSPTFCVGIWWHCFATAALQFNPVSAFCYWCASREWK